LFAVIKIVPPSKATAEQEELLKKLGATMTESPRDGRWD
jgi:cysteine synthase